MDDVSDGVREFLVNAETVQVDFSSDFRLGLSELGRDLEIGVCQCNGPGQNQRLLVSQILNGHYLR
jgi:hypothetical protein